MLRVACAYRTVSDIALTVVVGWPLVDLLAAGELSRIAKACLEKRMTFTRHSVETDGSGRPRKNGSADGI